MKKEDAIKFMVKIIQDEGFSKKEKPYVSDYLRKEYNLTEKQQANIEVRLEKIYSYLLTK